MSKFKELFALPKNRAMKIIVIMIYGIVVLFILGLVEAAIFA